MPRRGGSSRRARSSAAAPPSASASSPAFPTPPPPPPPASASSPASPTPPPPPPPPNAAPRPKIRIKRSNVIGISQPGSAPTSETLPPTSSETLPAKSKDTKESLPPKSKDTKAECSRGPTSPRRNPPRAADQRVKPAAGPVSLGIALSGPVRPKIKFVTRHGEDTQRPQDVKLQQRMESLTGCASGLSKQALDTRKEEKLTGVVEQVYVTEQSQQVLMVKKEKQAASMEQISLRRSVRNLEALKDKKHGIFAEQVFTSQQSQQGYMRKEENLTSQQIIETTKEEHAGFAEQQVNSSVCIIYDNKMLEHIPPKPKPGQEKHVEQPSRISAIYDRLLNDGLLERCSVYNSEPADLKHVLEVHKSHYVVRLIKGIVEPRVKEERDDMFMSAGSVDAMLLSAGGTLKSCEMVATRRHLHSFAVVRPPGHHAKADEERGFCFLNNVAIGAKYLMKHHNVKKILILDWDLHFGDGTSEIFFKDSHVLFISMHRYPYWPDSYYAVADKIGTGEGKGFNCNICWDEGITDDDLFAVFDYIVMPLVKEFDPEIILISCGFDAASGDTMGDCKLTHIGYATVLNKLLELKKSIVMVLEGGYAADTLEECSASCVKVLLGDTTVVRDMTDYYPLESSWDAILEVRKSLKAYWKCFDFDIPEEIIARIRPKEP